MGNIALYAKRLIKGLNEDSFGSKIQGGYYMFDKNVPLLKATPYLFKDQSCHTFYREYRLNGEKKTRHLKIRTYCFICGESTYQEIEIQKFPVRIKKEELLKTVKGLLYSEESDYVCSHCQHQHPFDSKSLTDLTKSSSLINKHVIVNELNDLIEESKDCIKTYSPKKAMKLNFSQVEGFQFIRYALLIDINLDSLEIKNCPLQWQRTYIHLNQGGVFTYKKLPTGEIQEIAKKSVFSNIYPHHWGVPDYLFLPTEELAPILKQTGLITYLSFLKQSNRRPYSVIYHLYRYEALRKDFPCVEQLVKAGYSAFIESLINTVYLESSWAHGVALCLNPKGTTPSQIFGLPNGILKRLRSLGAFESYERFIHLQGFRHDFAIDFRFLDSFDEFISLSDFINNRFSIHPLLSEDYTYSSLIRYARRMNRLHHLSPRDTWQLLLDYTKMAQELHVTVERFPKNLKEHHDTLQTLLKYERDEFIQRRFKEVAETHQYLCFAPQDENYFITIPTEPEELVKEGNALSHCVASYIGRVANGESLILFLRKKEQPDQSFITIEWREGRVIQARGFGNHSITKYHEANDFFLKWLDYTQSATLTQIA